MVRIVRFGLTSFHEIVIELRTEQILRHDSAEHHLCKSRDLEKGDRNVRENKISDEAL